MRLRIVSDLLTNSVISASVEVAHIRRRASRGAPQGGVMSSLLWNIAVEHLLKNLQQNDISLYDYANDLVIMWLKRQFPENGNYALYHTILNTQFQSTYTIRVLRGSEGSGGNFGSKTFMERSCNKEPKESNIEALCLLKSY